MFVWVFFFVACIVAIPQAGWRGDRLGSQGLAVSMDSRRRTPSCGFIGMSAAVDAAGNQCGLRFAPVAPR
jgi:hypothetical protein